MMESKTAKLLIQYKKEITDGVLYVPDRQLQLCLLGTTGENIDVFTGKYATVNREKGQTTEYGFPAKMVYEAAGEKYQEIVPPKDTSTKPPRLGSLR